MGLFGGFKAKFTKDSTAKTSKSVNKDEVVCLGYRVYSEFDNPHQYVHNPQETHRQQTAIRTVAPRTKSVTNSGEFNNPQPSTSTPIETQIVTNPKVKKSSKKKAPEAEKHVSTASLTPTNSIYEELSNPLSKNSATNISTPNMTLIKTESVKLRNGGLKEESRPAPSSTYIKGKTSSFNPNDDEILISSNNNNNDSARVTTQQVNIKAPRSILKQKSNVHNKDHISHNYDSTKSPDNNIVLRSDENIYSDTEYDRTMTLASSKTSKSDGYTTETAEYMSATHAVTESSLTQVATYVHTEVSSSADDVTVNNNYSSNFNYTGSNYNQNTRSIGNTSNHAASIFFDGDEEPEIQRPRRANLTVLPSEVERRSSAEC